jgi:cytochrome b
VGNLFGAGKELSDDLTGVHHFLFNVLWVAIVVHVVAALVYLMFKRDNADQPDFVQSLIDGHVSFFSRYFL